jgi:hypothetical protein
MITIKEYEDYFEAIAQKLGASFYAVDMSEFDTFLNAIRNNGVKFPALVVEDFYLKGSGPNKDQPIKTIYGAALWLDKFDARHPETKKATKIRTYNEIMKVDAICSEDIGKFGTLMYLAISGSFEYDFTIFNGDIAGWRMGFQLKK